MSEVEAPAQKRANHVPASGREVQRLLESTRRARRSNSASSRLSSSSSQYAEDMDALRVRNNFVLGPRICYLTGHPRPSSELQRAHLVPHSETRIPDVIDALQMLGTVPNVDFSRNLFKHTQRNLIPVENTLHSRMDLEFPGLLLAPSNGELISIIATLEEHLVAAETAVEAEHAPAYTHFHIDLDRVLDATGATSRYREITINVRLSDDPELVGWAAPLLCQRQGTDIIPHATAVTGKFPAIYEPPLPELWTALDISNVTIFFLIKLRDLTQADVLGELTPEMSNKPALARHYVRLLCTDKLYAWRALERPHPLPPPPPRSDQPFSALVKRKFTTANKSPPTRSSSRSASAAHHPSSDQPEVEEMLLRLGVSDDRTAVNTRYVEASDTLPAPSGDAGTMLLTGQGDDSMSDSGSSMGASTGPTSPDTSRECKDVEILQYDAACEGCLADRALCDDIEITQIPRAQSKIRKMFRDRADDVGTGKALLEVFFLEEGLKYYSPLRAEVSALADEVDRLKFGELDPAIHTCLF